MMDVTFKLQREEILAFIKIESLWGKSVSEILTALQDVDQNCPFGFSTVCRWVQKFKSGRSKLLLKHNSGPRSATDRINTEKVAQILNTDRRLTCDEIAYKVGLSGASHYRILTEFEYEKDSHAMGTAFSIGI